jgi:heme exporter protein A
MSAPAGVVVAARELTHRYGHRSVFDGLNFEFGGPGAIAVRGHNGSGKTTLLRILAGLLRPTSGEAPVRVNDRAVPPLERHRWVGYAGPDLAFYPELTALENLRFAAETRALDRPGDRAQQALDGVGLLGRAGDRVAALSSGMVQRLRLAFALLHDPPLVLLDEPGSHLDAGGLRDLATLVQRERQQRLMLIATNDEREAALAERHIQLVGSGLLAAS